MPRFDSFTNYLKKNFGKTNLAHISGDLKMPFIGDSFRFLHNTLALFEEKRQKYGNVFKVRLFGDNVVFLSGAEANKFVLIEQAKYFSSKEGWNFSIGELFHGGLMLRDEEEHKHHRSILQTAFKKDPLAAYLEDIIPSSQQYLEAWQHIDQINIFPAMKAMTLQIAGKVFFGLDFKEDLATINQAIIQVVKASTTALPLSIPYTTYWYGVKARKTLEKYFYNIIAERRKNPTQDIFGKLCTAENEEGAKLSDQDIIDHLIFLLMAGHDTTASTLTSLFYELSVNPEWQERLRKASVQFNENKELNFQTINQLEELDWAVKETLRLHPPLIMIPRKTTQEMQFEGINLPAQTTVAVLIYHNHGEDKYFKNPQKFDPERYANQRAEHKKCPHAYAPFGAGQHFCLGYAFAEMQIKAVMHLVLSSYRWSVPQNYTAPYNPIPLQEPKDGLPVKIEQIVTKKAFAENI